MSAVVCWNCGRDLADIPRPISRHNNCPACFSDLHCCRMCKHFLPERVGVCAEDRADPPVEKENANFCSFFVLIRDAFNPNAKSKSDAAKDALVDLFGKAPNTDNKDSDPESTDAPTTDPALDALNALFKPKK